MTFLLARNWWSLVIRGIVGIVLGILAFTRPGFTLAALVLFFGAYALIDGIVSVAGAVRAANANESWGVLLFEGIVGILAGTVTFMWPAITTLALVYVIAIWAVIHGIAEVAAAIRLRRHISGEWLLVVAGVLSIIFGLLIAMSPGVGALVIAMWLGVYAFIFGFLLLALGLRLRSWAHHPPHSPFPVPAH